MGMHMNSFTPDAMRTFGQELVAETHRRIESIKNTRNQTLAMLSDFRKEHSDSETNRQRRAGRDADSRRLFMSELKSGVHSLLNRFELSRKEVAEDHQKMASEVRLACDAFQKRSTPPAQSSAIDKSVRASNRSNGRGGPSAGRSNGFSSNPSSNPSNGDASSSHSNPSTSSFTSSSSSESSKKNIS